MKKIGIIVEYNPLHNGHLIHLNKIREKTNADIIIACMTSSFSSRGDLSIFDKFEKTRQALEAKVDLIVEFPFVYSLERADVFAKNAIDILNLMQVDEIWIGSEENNIDLYEEAYLKYTDEFNLDDGKSLKKASIDVIPFKSNDVLGFFYFKRIVDKGYNIELHTIKRELTNFLENIIHDEHIASSSAIRANLELIDKFTPKYVSSSKDKILDENKLFSFLKYKILSSTTDELKEIFLVDEGLEYKLKKEINSYDNKDDFINSLVSKRYTKTRIKRMLSYILFNITKKEINMIQPIDINFIRVLGFNEIGREYLRKIKKDVDIYTNIKEGINMALDIELRISKILDMIYNTNVFEQEQSKPKENDDFIKTKNVMEE